MADYNSQAAYQPAIPKYLISKEDLEFIKAFGVDVELNGDDKLYFFEEKWCTIAFMENSEGNEVEHREEDLLARFQEIIRRSNGELPWISRETAYTCSERRPDGFGGSSVFITADDIQYFGTSSWLEQRISEAETGDIGPHTDDMPPVKPILSVVIDGGLVQAVISNDPSQLPIDTAVIIDYDVDGADSATDLYDVRQSDGSTVKAFVGITKFDKAGIDLDDVVAQVQRRL